MSFEILNIKPRRVAMYRLALPCFGRKKAQLLQLPKEFQ